MSTGLPAGITLERLRELVVLLTAANASLTALEDTRESLGTDLQRTVEGSFEAFGAVTSTSDGPLFVGALEALLDATKTGCSAQERDFETAERAVESLRETCRNGASALEVAADESHDEIETLSQLAAQFLVSQGDHEETSASAVETFVRSLQEGSQELLDAHEAATTGIVTCTEEVSDHTDAGSAAMGGLGDTIKSTVHDAVHHAFAEAGKHAKETFEAYVSKSTSDSEAWVQVVTGALKDATVHAAEQVGEEIERGTEQVVLRGLELLTDELIHQSGLMTAGGAVTTAIAPALPAIVAAKVAVHLLNEIF